MNRHKRSLLIAGTAMAAFGLVCIAAWAYLMGLVDNGRFDGLAGALCGLGFGLLGGGGATAAMALWRVSPDRERQKEIEQHDERNIQVNRAALSVTAVAAFIVLAVLTFIFVIMGWFAAGILTVAAMYVLIAVYLIAHSRMNRVM